VSCAGHPLPLLRRTDGEVEALGQPGLLLGVAHETAYDEWPVAIPTDSHLVCFTDGVGDGHPDHGDGPAAVLSHLAGPAGPIADAICRAAQGRQLPQDDVVVLVIAFSGTDQSAKVTA
jgi:serine phosphatase RsbU (regulator of sigma subunit)